MPEYDNDTGELITTNPDTVGFQRFDAQDDAQIMAEIQGRNLDILSQMVYSYTDRRGNTITGLSLTGVRETVREMNRRGLARIRVTATPPQITETDEYVDVIVYAEDDLNGGGAWGAKRQPKKAGNYANPFAMEQALSKAQRNAMLALIPATYVVEVIKEYSQDGKTHAISEQAERPRLSPVHSEASQAAQEASSGEKATEPQVRMIRSLLGRTGMAESELLEKLGLAALSEMTRYRASQVIDRLLQRAEKMKESGA